MAENERTITLGGKPYPAKLTLGVLAKAEARAKKNYLDPDLWLTMRDGKLELSALDVVALAWACADPALTYDQVAGMLTPSRATYDIRATLVDSFISGFAEVDEDPKAPFGPATSPDGPKPEPISDSAATSTKP